MAILNLSKIKSIEELEARAIKDLQWKSLLQIAKWIQESDQVSRVSSKASVGYLIENGYFGIKRNSDKSPDIASLGVEIKTSPLKLGKDGKLRVKEPLSLNIINYTAEARNSELKESSLYKKNHRILFIWYIHNPSEDRSKYIIKYVFLWEMDDEVISELTPDYEKIVKKIREGNAHNIHQSDNEMLTLCPKHGGVFRDPKDNKSKTKQPFSDAPAEIRAFRLKNSYMNKVIRRYLSKTHPDRVDEFINE